MKYEVCASNPSFEEYKNLHQTTGWNVKGLYTYDQLYQAICNSWFSASIYDGITLVGYGRIISDGIYQTFVCDVMVHPDYQRKRIGSQVMASLLAHCKQENIKWVQLFCAKGKQSFYQQFGFTARDLDAPGMMVFYD